MQHKMFLLKESRHNEKRVALIPSDVAKLIDSGVIVYVEDSAGLGAGYTNEDYISVGAHIRQINYEQVESYKQAFNDITIIVRVKRPDRRREQIENSVIKPYTQMVGFLDTLERDAEHISEYEHAKIQYYSLDQFAFPAGTPMDSLKEMSKIAGRQALKHAIQMVTPPVRHVVIIGGSAAGFAASQECVRLNIQHTFITSDLSKAELLRSQGICSAVIGRDLPLEVRQEKVYQVIKNADIIITTASSAWVTAPLLIPEATLKKLKRGTTIIDLATSDGGNVFGSKHDEIITLSNGVKVVNVSGYPKQMPVEASRFLSKANSYFLNLLVTSHDTLNAAHKRVVFEM